MARDKYNVRVYRDVVVRFNGTRKVRMYLPFGTLPERVAIPYVESFPPIGYGRPRFGQAILERSPYSTVQGLPVYE